MLAGLTALLGGGAGGGGASFESIATATGTGSSGAITFSGIPSTYKHLQVRITARNLYSGNSLGRAIYFNLNSDSTDSYTLHRLWGDGSSASASGSGVTGALAGYIDYAAVDNGASANIQGVAIVDIQDYTATTRYKTVRNFSGADLNNTNGKIYLTSTLWLNTAAINSISFTDPTGNGFSTGTKIALYGIKG